MTTISVTRPATVIEPRGAAWAAQAAARALAFVSGLLARREQRIEQTGRHAEASYVRRLADSLRTQDPRFAEDLYAAADRHETT
jgi:hypothetical protein